MSNIDKYPAYCKWLIDMADNSEFMLSKLLFYEIQNQSEMAFDIVFESHDINNSILKSAVDAAREIIKKYGHEQLS